MSIADTFKTTTINLVKKQSNNTDINAIDIEMYSNELYEKELLPICRKQIDNLKFYNDFDWLLSDKMIDLFKKDGFTVEILKNNLVCEYCLGKTCYFCNKGNITRIKWN